MDFARMATLTFLATAAALPLAATAETHTVIVDGMKFVPALLTVRKGDRVVWKNKDVVPHTATAAGRFDSRLIATGQSWTYVARKPGRHDYVCTFHPGMKATLVVQ
jgi:plastocyanin